MSTQGLQLAERKLHHSPGQENKHADRRQQHLDRQEEGGELLFKLIRNDGREDHMQWLIDLKNLYSKQLPNMPKDYIVRLVFDRQHYSLVALKGGLNGRLIAGITYRPFYTQSLGEIAFCAVSAHEQVKGYGTRIMNKLKEHVMNDTEGGERLDHLITFADNNAVGYFSKQGFQKEIVLDKEKWSGYIKEYDGGTLMECVLGESGRPALPSNSEMKEQKSEVEQIVQSLSKDKQLFNGLEVFRSLPEGEYARVDPKDIPGVKELGFIPNDPPFKILHSSAGDGTPTTENMHGFMREMVRIVSQHQDAWPFREPVDSNEVPDYYDVIKDPVDLSLISRRIESQRYYANLHMFAADFARMFNNARVYNGPDTIYYKAANR